MATIIDVDPDTPSDVADARVLVKDLAGGCKVKVVYGERSANTPNEDNGPLAASARRVISLQVVLLTAGSSTSSFTTN